MPSILERRVEVLETKTAPSTVVVLRECSRCGKRIPIGDDSPCEEHPPAPADGCGMVVTVRFV
jgi:hypothetical protein